MGKYRSLGTIVNRLFRNNLNANFDDIDADIQAQKTRVDDLVKGTPQPSEIVDARGGFSLLRDRLSSIDSSLVQKAQQSLASLKSDANATFLFTQPTDATYNGVQGMCLTDKYIIVAVIGASDSDNTRLYVLDKNTNQLSSSFTPNPIVDRSFGHANSMTYNSKTNEVIITSINKNVWVLDANTLVTKNTLTLGYTVAGVSYDSKNDQYILKNGVNIYICDTSFVEKSRFTIDSVPYIHQSLEVYDDMIFVPYYDIVTDTSMPASNYIFVYDLKGELIKSYLLAPIGELEDLVYMDGRFLANYRSGNNIVVYTVNLLPRSTYTTSDMVKSNETLVNYRFVASGDDLNNYTMPGVYKINGTGLAATVLNCPTPYNAKIRVEYIQNTSYVLQTVISRDNKIFTRTQDGTGVWSAWSDTGWIPLTLQSGVTIGDYGRTTPSYRKIGNHVFISGSVVVTPDATTSVILAYLPTGFIPLKTQYTISAGGGQRITRVHVNSSDGSIRLEYAWDLTTNARTTTNTWYDITMDFFID